MSRPATEIESDIRVAKDHGDEAKVAVLQGELNIRLFGRAPLGRQGTPKPRES